MEKIIGTIAITGSEGQVGRAVYDRLRGLVRAAGDGAVPGAVRVAPRPLDGAMARSVLEQADAIVHLAGALRPRPGESLGMANVATTRAIADAVRGAASKRVLYLSYVGASEASANEYLRTKAYAERLLFDSGAQVIVFRCTHIIGPPESPGPTARSFLVRRGRTVTVLGDGWQQVAPVYLGDVTSALIAALKTGPPGVYELAGPETTTVDGLVRLLNRDPDLQIRHVPPLAARALGLIHPELSLALVDLMLRDSVGDPARAVAAFGLTLTSLRSVWEPRQASRQERVERALRGAA